VNLSAAAIVLRERKALEVMDLSLRFVRALAPLSYVRLGLVVLLPPYVSCLALRYALHLDWGYVWLAAFVSCIFLQGPFTVLSGRLLFSDRPTVLEVVGATFRRTLPYGFLLIVRALLLVLSAVTLLGPFVILVYGAFLHEVVLLESAGVRSALGRSRRFVLGRSGSAVEMLLLVGCLYGLCIVLAEMLGLAVMSYVFDIDRQYDTLADDNGSIFSLAGLFLAVPLATTLRFLFYVNERTLRDGWDVQVRFLGIRDALEKRAS
jgi:hypothetical protein